jgi:hypothetical protein
MQVRISNIEHGEVSAIGVADARFLRVPAVRLRDC